MKTSLHPLGATTAQQQGVHGYPHVCIYIYIYMYIYIYIHGWSSEGLQHVLGATTRCALLTHGKHIYVYIYIYICIHISIC